MAKFITGKEILQEIQTSKNSFCWFKDPTITWFDIIVDKNYVEDTKMLPFHQQTLKPGFIVRVMTNDHIPTKILTASKRVATISLNFPAFKHYTWTGTDWEETARSHWQGSLSNGEFSQSHGRLTNRLGEIYHLLVTRYATRGNWRGYSCLDEMKGEAIFALIANGLKYNEAKANGNQTFAYLTRIMQNSFQKVLKLEKRQDGIVDDLEFASGKVELTHSQQAKLEIDRYYGKQHTSYASLRGEKPKQQKEKMIREKTMFNSIFTWSSK